MHDQEFTRLILCYQMEQLWLCFQDSTRIMAKIAEQEAPSDSDLPTLQDMLKALVLAGTSTHTTILLLTWMAQQKELSTLEAQMPAGDREKAHAPHQQAYGQLDVEAQLRTKAEARRGKPLPQRARMLLPRFSDDTHLQASQLRGIHCEPNSQPNSNT